MIGTEVELPVTITQKYGEHTHEGVEVFWSVLAAGLAPYMG